MPEMKVRLTPPESGANSDLYPFKEPIMRENISDYVTPYAEQTPFSYAIQQTLPFINDEVSANNRYTIVVEFYNLPPNATLTLTPTVPIANVTATLRVYSFNLAESLPQINSFHRNGNLR